MTATLSSIRSTYSIMASASLTPKQRRQYERFVCNLQLNLSTQEMDMLDRWLAERDIDKVPTREFLYLTCRGCGETFREDVHLLIVQEHGNSDPSGSAGWCGEDGFDLVPESEAL